MVIFIKCDLLFDNFMGLEMVDCITVVVHCGCAKFCRVKIYIKKENSHFKTFWLLI